MADETKPELTEREKAIKAYNEADTKEKKAEVVKQYPLLKEIYSAINHS